MCSAHTKIHAEHSVWRRRCSHGPDVQKNPLFYYSNTHTRTKHTSASRTPDIAERCRSKAVGDWKSESCIHLRLCAASLELHCTYIFFFVFVCALWDKNCLLCTLWFTLLQEVHTDSNPSGQVKVMYLKDVSVTSPTGFGRSILTTNLPKYPSLTSRIFVQFWWVNPAILLLSYSVLSSKVMGWLYHTAGPISFNVTQWKIICGTPKANTVGRVASLSSNSGAKV